MISTCHCHNFPLDSWGLTSTCHSDLTISRNAYEVQALKDSLMEIKEGLHPKNLSKFENDVEVHMQHIQTGLSQMGNLRVFMLNSNNQQNQHKVKVVPTVRVKSESK